MSERPKALERLSVAMSSSDLTLDFEHRTDLDYVVALGIAEARHSRISGPLMRLHTTTSRLSLREAYHSVDQLTRRMNVKLNWRLSGDGIRAVAERSLAHHIAPACPHCSGRGFEMQPSAPVLSTKACSHCHGTGKRPVQKKYREEIKRIVSILEEIDSSTERMVARLVR
ncbi:hypothetical protein [Polynucleobacter sp. UK-Kesae-W10]|uniref:hypothetical protein n=1 Tax=Polynucleobacter sp. UK-Kesae-W10 TaxID=1819738 RepID=UPI001C0AEF9D|nr:hypothetical protein [Polynucleobacter sp. UK-Kesae-W10]MBU3577525.1 hypothetical protein [Polynucleobacter sp. UK-Kesae-W10]